MISSTFNRYIWLLNTLLQHRRLTFEEISRLWESGCLGDGRPLALRTFHIHRKAIAELFGIEVKCDPSTYKYYLSSTDVLANNRAIKWLINSFTVSNMIRAGHNMKDRILFEEIPGGTEYIQSVIDAMQRGKILRIDYQPYSKDSRRITFEFHPYAMKVYHQRWYLVGLLADKSGIRNISLDRILEIEVTDKSFVYPDDFDAKKYYKNTIGIFLNEELKPQKVRIRVYGMTVDYLRSLPLHQSQAEVKTKYGEYSEFEYHISLTPELTSQLLAMGENVEVIEPQQLRDDVVTRLQASLDRYKIQ